MEHKTWKIFLCVDKYFGIWLLIKHILNFLNILGQNLNIFVSLVDLTMYDMQITSYYGNFSFFMDEFIINVIIQHTKSLLMCFLF